MKRLVLMVCIFAAFTIFTAGCASKTTDVKTPVADATGLTRQSTSIATPISAVAAAVKPTVAPIVVAAASEPTVQSAVSEKEIDKLFQEASKTFDTVLALVREGKDIRNYAMIEPNFADPRQQGGFPSNYSESQIRQAKEREAQEELAKVERLAKALLKKEKAKITEIEIGGDSEIGVSVCDREGLCEAFLFQNYRSKNGWGIYEIRKREMRELQRVKGYVWTTTAESFALVEKFFELLRRNQVAETANLFSERQGTSSIKTDGVVKAVKGLQIAKIEKIYERTIESLWAKMRLWNPNGDSESRDLYFVKDKEGHWRILAAQF